MSRPGRFLRHVLRFATIAAVGIGAAAGTAVGTTAPAIGVVFADADETAGGDIARIVAGIERESDVVIFRLAANDTLIGGLLRAGGIKLAMAGTAGGIAVLYPDIGEPYRAVFAKIIEGVEEQTRSRVVSYAVGKQSGGEEIAAALKRQEIKVVIVLGRQGMQAAVGLEREFGVIAGGVVSAPEADTRSYPVMSLAPDPALLFDRLKRFMPAARRVFVVYDGRHNEWLIRRAREAARAQGLELVAHEAQDLKAAVRAYQEALAAIDPKKDALWLPQDLTTVEDSAVLPLVLEDAWNRSLTVFSSNVAHVRRGVLFSLYPNNVALGRNLASSAQAYLVAADRVPRGLSPLKDVLVAVNVRTANRLGLQHAVRQQNFDLIFPEP